MNRRPFIQHHGLLTGFSAFFLFGSAALAQLNEDRIERDATGVYKGKIQGGQLTISPSDPPGTPFVTPPTEGRLRVPIKDGAVRSNMTDDNLPGNDRAVMAGAWQKTTVLRAGKLISVQGTGSVDEDDGANGKWSKGKVIGSFTEKGPKWHAKNVVKSATKAFAEGFSEQIRNLQVSGKD